MNLSNIVIHEFYEPRYLIDEPVKTLGLKVNFSILYFWSDMKY